MSYYKQYEADNDAGFGCMLFVIVAIVALVIYRMTQ